MFDQVLAGNAHIHATNIRQSTQIGGSIYEYLFRIIFSKYRKI